MAYSEQARQALRRNAAKGTRAMMRHAAIRAASDPVELARALRIVRAAIHEDKATLADLDGPIVPESP